MLWALSARILSLRTSSSTILCSKIISSRFDCGSSSSSALSSSARYKSTSTSTMSNSVTPKLSDSKGVTIQDILQLPRPSAGLPNPSKTLALWPSSTFSFEGAGGKGRTEKSFYLVDLTQTTSIKDDRITSGPQKILGGLAMTEVVWLDDDSILFLRPSVPDGQEPNLESAENRADSQGGRKRVDHPVEKSDKDQKASVKKASGESGGDGVEVWALNVKEGEEYKIAKLPVPVANLQVVSISSEKEAGIVLAFSAGVYEDGDVYKVSKHQKAVEEAARGSDVKVYDSLFIRHWDEWKGTSGEITQLHFVKLVKTPEDLRPSHSEEGNLSGDDFEHIEKPVSGAVQGGNGQSKGRWSMVMAQQDTEETDEKEPSDIKNTKAKKKKNLPVIKSPLAGTKFECPVGAFGGVDDYSLSSTHLVFHAKDIHVNPAWHTRTQVYLVPLSPRSKADTVPKVLTVGTQGACSSPVFSEDGKRIAWLEMREDGYEADRNRIMIYEIESGVRWGVTEKWDRSPTKIKWCPCGEKLYLVAEDQGHVKLFQVTVPLDGASSSNKLSEPTVLTRKHTIYSFEPLSTSSLLLTVNSLTGPNYLSLFDVPKADVVSAVVPSQFSSMHLSMMKNKSLDAGEEFWFPGAEAVEVHGFILFPPEARAMGQDLRRKSGKKWPLAFLVHGGPQGAWTDSWSTRWNPNFYASQGYITVTINPTGSTGYGQKFCDDIKNNWGGSPFQDLVAGLDFVKTAFPEIDSDRMAMLGASYGGFMANWVQGHNDQMGFKAIVCHDGVFSTSGTWYATEELYFPEREFGGTPWTAAENYAKWNPQNHIKKWKTPQLVIHGGRDYRLVEGEGIGVFNTLQRLGIPSRFVYFASENHWVLEAHNGVRWHEEVIKWLDEWTGEDSK